MITLLIGIVIGIIIDEMIHAQEIDDD